MTHLATLVCAMLIGAAWGYLLGHLRAMPLVVSVAAALLGWLTGTIAYVIRWVVGASAQSGIAAVSVGAAEITISAILVALGAVLLHFALGWLGRDVIPSLDNRPLLLGALGAGSAVLVLALTVPTGTRG